MSSDTLYTLVMLVITAILIASNALFVFHEFAFVVLKPPQIAMLENSRDRMSNMIARMARQLDHYIAVDQLGITITSIAVGWVGQPVITDLLRTPFGAIGLPSGAASVTSFVVAFALITAVQMIAGELMPKSVALRNPLGVARMVAIPVEITARVLHPLVWVLNGMGNLTVRALGFSPQSDSHGASALPVEELLVMIKASAQAGAIESDPMLLRRTLHFSDIEALDLIVPRQDVIALNTDMTIDELLDVARSAGYTRYPVYEGSIDNVIGVLNVKDLVQIDDNGQVNYVANWRRWVRPIPVLSEHASIEQVLQRLSQDKQPLVLLLDEYGGTAGIITASDIADSLIGGADDIRQEDDNRYVLKGETAVSTVEAALDIALGDEQERNYDSIGGLMMEELGRVPDVGDQVTLGSAELEVLSMDGRRVTEVSLFLPDAPAHTDEDDDREN